MSADIAGPDLLLRADAFREARRHSRRVRVLKFALPLAAVTMAGLFAFSTYHASSSGVVLSNAGSAVEQNKLVMANPRLEGFSRDSRPFTVDALRAMQALGNDQLVQLDAINARLPMDAGWVTVTAPGGVYDRVKNVLNIAGADKDAIKVISSDGSTVSMRTAAIDMGTGVLRATDTVDIKQKGGAVTADELEVGKGGKVLVFEKNVRMTLDPTNGPAGGPASGKSGDGNANP